MPFNPATDLPGLLGLYDAASGLWTDTGGTSAASSLNDVVVRWDDQSGNARHLTTLSGSSGFHFKPNSGTPYVHSRDGTSYLLGFDFPSSLASQATYSVAFLVRHVIPSYSSNVFGGFKRSGAGVQARASHWLIDDIAQSRLRTGDAGGSLQYGHHTMPTPASSFHCQVHCHASGTATASLDGAPMRSTSGVAATETLDGIYLGPFLDGGVGTWWDCAWCAWGTGDWTSLAGDIDTYLREQKPALFAPSNTTDLVAFIGASNLEGPYVGRPDLTVPYYSIFGSDGNYAGVSFTAEAINFARGGYRLTHDLADWETRVLPVVGNYRRTSFYIHHSGNDFFGGVNGVDHAASMLAWVEELRDTHGIHAVVSTYPKRSDVTENVTLEGYRVAYNAAILASDWPWIHDPTAEPELDDYDDTDYFVDGIHFTAAGAEVFARGIPAVLDSAHARPNHFFIETPAGILPIRTQPYG